jgi:hypothetical protein
MKRHDLEIGFTVCSLEKKRKRKKENRVSEAVICTVWLHNPATKAAHPAFTLTVQVRVFTGTKWAIHFTNSIDYEKQ